MLADLPDLGLDALQIVEGLRLAPGIPEEGGGVVQGGHPHPVFLEPLPVLPGDLEVLLDELHGGDAPQTDDDLGPQQRHLVAEIVDAGVLLGVQGVPVLGRAALDDVADVHVLLPAQPDEGEHLIQQLPRLAHKGDALLVLVLPGALPHHHDLRVVRACPEHHMGAGVRQGAPLAVPARLLQLFPAPHGPPLLSVPTVCFLHHTTQPGAALRELMPGLRLCSAPCPAPSPGRRTGPGQSPPPKRGCVRR